MVFLVYLDQQVHEVFPVWMDAMAHRGTLVLQVYRVLLDRRVVQDATDLRVSRVNQRVEESASKESRVIQAEMAIQAVQVPQVETDPQE